MFEYLWQNSLIYAFQSGFQADHSTDTAFTFLADGLRFNMDDGLYTGMILLIDFQKAFDTVDYSILAMKLKAIGADRPSVSWFESYLSRRKQLVNVNGRFSELSHVTCGVPQGYILGPLLFIIYVNDMVQSKL